MPAVIRGAPKGGRGGRGRAPQRPAPAAYAPGKLGRGGAIGLDPRMAVWAVGGVIGAGLLVALAIGGARTLEHGVGGLFDRAGIALGFRLNTLTIQGAQAVAAPAIAAAAGLNPGDPILSINLDRLRERVAGVGWVKSAVVRRVLPDTVVLTIKPRTLLAVWQHGGLAEVVDTDGHSIPEARIGDFPDLPLIVGEGANEAAAAVLPLLQARPRLMSRIDALQRVDGRRWRLTLKEGGVIDLPATGEDGALIQFDQNDARFHLLDLGFERVDLRDPAMTDVRMKGAPSTMAQTAAGSAAASTR